MVAKLWARQIISETKTFDQIPRLLKDQVKKILIDTGHEDLVIE